MITELSFARWWRDILAVCGILALVPACPVGADPLFRAPFRAYAPVPSTRTVALGDFDRDGALDIAVGSDGTNSIAILHSAGHGEFLAPSYLTARNYSVAITTADLDADGRLDLVVCPRFGNAVSVFLGVGDGSFSGRADFTTGAEPRWVAIGDVDRDGKLDLVVANSESFYGRSISVLLGNGDGTFQAKLDSYMGVSPSSVALADFNEDGLPDVVAGYEGGATFVYVMFGLGGGRFGPINGYDSGYNPITVATGDLNGDGHQDFIVGGAWSGNVSLHFGRGDGTFLPKVQLPITGAGFVTLGDVNPDGHLDILSLGAVMVGHGDGSFDPPIAFKSDFDVAGLAVGDLDGDGRVDMVTADHFPGTVSILAGRGDGSFEQPGIFAAPAFPQGLAAGDVDGDGRVDIAVASYDDHVVSLLLGDGAGGFSRRVDIAGDFNPVAVELADLNRDGSLDLVTVNFGIVSTMLGTGFGTFGSRQDFPVGTGARALATADLNEDGRPDVVTANQGAWSPSPRGDFVPDSTISILLGAGDGAFVARTDVDVGIMPYAVRVADVDRDGHEDVLVANARSSTVSVLLGSGDGSFHARQDFSTGTPPIALALGDFDADDRIDICTANEGSGSITVLLGNGDGTFRRGIEIAGLGLLNWLGAGDWNGDGMLDLAVTRENNNTVHLLLGHGDGTFSAADLYGTGGGPIYGEVTDLNRDGHPDIVVANYYGSSITALLSMVSGGLPTPTTLAFVSQESWPGRVRLTWYSSQPMETDITAERRSTIEEWRPTGVVRVERDRLILEDDSVTPGGRYAYRLRAGMGGGVLAGEVWVEIPEVPHLALYALSSAHSPGIQGIAFTLTTSEPVRLEVYDPAGRRVLRREFEGFGPGPHTVNLEEASGWKSGIYLAWLLQGVSSARAKLCVLR